MKSLLILTTIIGAAVVGCHATSQDPEATKSSDSDRNYLQQVMDRDQDMIAIANLAERNASSEHFRSMAHNCFVKQQDQSHQLEEWLVQWYGVRYTSYGTEEGRRTLDHLTSLKGSDFDREYLTDMIHEYQANVDVSGPESSSARDPEIRTFAQQLVKEQSHQVSHLQEHLAELTGADAAHDNHAGGHEHAHDEH